MADHDPPGSPLPQPEGPGARCPWCSAPVAGPDDATCGTCGATLKGDVAIEIPGVTAIDMEHVLRISTPRRARPTLGSLLVGGDDEILPPTAAELPALAMPDAEVRREMLRLRLDAELADLTARAAALAAERGIPVSETPGALAEPDAPQDATSPPPPAADEPPAGDHDPARDAAQSEDDARP